MTRHLTDEQLVDYVYRTLADDRRVQMDRHLAVCVDCRAQLGEHQAAKSRIHASAMARRNHAVPVTRLTYASIAPRVKRPRQITRFEDWLTRFLSGTLALAALIALMFLLMIMFSGRSQPVAVVRPVPSLPPTTSAYMTVPAAAASTSISTPAFEPQLVWETKNNPNPLSVPFGGLALDRQGNFYVVDAGNARIVKYDRAGKYLAQWGGRGEGDGQLNFTLTGLGIGGGIAIDDNGNVYVADTDNHRVQKFDDTGHFLMKWGSEGFGAGQFMAPAGLAVDSQGNVYISDISTTRIQKFDSNGQLLQWTAQDSTHQRLVAPIGIAIDSHDSIYALDQATRSIHKFDRDGKFIVGWMLSGDSNDPQTITPAAIALDSSENIYVTDIERNRVCKFDPDGKFVSSWGKTGNGDGEFDSPGGIAVDTQGNVYVADSNNARILKFSQTVVANPIPILPQTTATSSATPTPVPPAPASALKPVATPELIWKIDKSPDSLSAPFGLALDRQGNLYIVDTSNSRILKYNRDGKFLMQWGSRGQDDGQFAFSDFGNFASVAVDNQGDVYVTDADNRRIQKFDATGHFLLKWGSEGNDAGQFRAPSGLALDSQGNVYVADFGTARIQKFSNAGQILRWTSQGSSSVQLVAPIDVALDDQGFIYIADRATGSIQKFDPDGKSVAKWLLNCGSDSGQTVTPSAIALDTKGNLYVSDTQSNRICKFDPTGKFIATWGRTGQGDGEFNFPGGIAVDAQGNVYVADTNNARILKFSQP